jgi:hypothetical protein
MLGFWKIFWKLKKQSFGRLTGLVLDIYGLGKFRTVEFRSVAPK